MTHFLAPCVLLLPVTPSNSISFLITKIDLSWYRPFACLTVKFSFKISGYSERTASRTSLLVTGFTPGPNNRVT